MSESRRSSLKQIPTNLTREEDDEEQEEKDSLFSEPEERKDFDGAQTFNFPFRFL